MVELVLALARPRVRILLPPRRYFRASDVRPPSLREPDPLEHPNPPPKVQVPKSLHSFAPVVGAPRRKKVGECHEGRAIQYDMLLLSGPSTKQAFVAKPRSPQSRKITSLQTSKSIINQRTTQRVNGSKQSPTTISQRGLAECAERLE